MKDNTEEDRVIELEFAIREMVHQTYGLIDVLKDMPASAAAQKITIGFLEQIAEIGTKALFEDEEGEM